MLLPRSGRAKHRRAWYRPSPKNKDKSKERRKSARRQAQRRLRRRQRLGAVKKGLVKGGALGLVIALIAGLGGGLYLLTRDEDEPQPEPVPSVEAVVEDKIDTTLVFGTKEKAGDSAKWLTLLSLDETSGQASVIYVPAHTATEVPGHGLLGVGESLGSGGIPLLLVTTENMLGVQIDRHVELSDSDALVLFDETGPLTVDVPVEVSIAAGENQTRLLFEQGRQSLPSKFLKMLLFTVGAGGDEAELGSRHLAFWEALFEEFAEEPEQLGSAIDAASPVLAESGESPEDLASFFEALVSVPADARTLAVLPVRQVSVGGDELYEVDMDTLPSFMEETLGSQPSLGDEIRVQILNGNGVPGIGEEVAEKLSKENFRVLLSGNARSLDYEKTLIVTYDSSEEGIEIAERAQALLGVGEVQVSAQGQGIVDLTIVVGKDFLRAD